MDHKTILIADDDLKLLEALRVRLEAEGYEVISTQDAYQALQRVHRTRPDLLVLDINMPAGTGFSVQQRMADIEELAGIPIIYITGEVAEAVDRTAEELGAFAVVHKPFETEQLLDTVRQALGYGVHKSSRNNSA